MTQGAIYFLKNISLLSSNNFFKHSRIRNDEGVSTIKI